MPYVRYYEDCFLDGIHNNFPEILYGPPEQFGGAAPLVAYIQRQIQSRLDLFSSARRSFTSQALQTPPRVQPRATEPPVTVRSTETISQIIGRTLLSSFDNMPGLDIHTLNTMYVHPTSPMQNVIVRPSIAQIAAGTQIEIVDAEEEFCTICQDRMEAGSEARVIRICDHRFHIECIDTWFERSVFCPTCRHDVRDLEPEPSSS
jgi:hypothetical protein